LPDVAVIRQVAPVSFLHIPSTAVVGRLPVLEGDAFPQTSDVVLVAIIYGDTEVASLDSRPEKEAVCQMSLSYGK